MRLFLFLGVSRGVSVFFLFLSSLQGVGDFEGVIERTKPLKALKRS